MKTPNFGLLACSDREITWSIIALSDRGYQLSAFSLPENTTGSHLQAKDQTLNAGR
ncbi:MAG: hypothetical protein OEY21_06665 [Nitrospira sp.]|nr:hypothetical protein [Nitrospira sp.]MDH5625772.1 hypothetical protein [Nitrospira sp.]